jgi:hypothetical protein
MSEWTFRPHLRSADGQYHWRQRYRTERLNGNYFLNTRVANGLLTVNDDNAKDMLTGASGQDMVLCQPVHGLLGRSRPEGQDHRHEHQRARPRLGFHSHELGTKRRRRQIIRFQPDFKQTNGCGARRRPSGSWGRASGEPTHAEPCCGIATVLPLLPLVRLSSHIDLQHTNDQIDRYCLPCLSNLRFVGKARRTDICLVSRMVRSTTSDS